MKIILKNTPLIPYEGWKVDYHNGITNFDPQTLSLHLEPEQEKKYIKGHILAERLKDKALNASVLDYLLENPKLIPDEWKGKWVYFWGTIYRNSGGDLYVRCLDWDDGQWQSNYHWLDDGWNSGNPAAVSASSSISSEPKNSALRNLDLDSAKSDVKEKTQALIKALQDLDKTL